METGEDFSTKFGSIFVDILPHINNRLPTHFHKVLFLYHEFMYSRFLPNYNNRLVTYSIYICSSKNEEIIVLSRGLLLKDVRRRSRRLGLRKY